MVQVFNGNLSISNDEMTVQFSNGGGDNGGFVYTGRSLILDFETAATNSYNNTNTTWKGASTEANTVVCVSGTNHALATTNTNSRSFLPQVTITYNHIDVDYLADLDGISNFGVIQNGTIASTTIIVTNYGTKAFTPVLTSSNEAFAVSSEETGPLASGETREFTVTFSPTKATEYASTLTLSAPESTDIAASVVLTGEGSNTFIVADGNDTNQNVPVWGLWYDSNSTHHQMIYPASMLEHLKGKDIKSITFYPNSSGIGFGGGALTVTMGTASVDAFSSTSPSYEAITENQTLANADITPTQGDQIMHIEFDEPFEYTSGNLIIDTQVKTAATYGSTTWLGVNTDNYQSVYGRTDTPTPLQFLPKITFEYETNIKVNPANFDFGEVPVGTTSNTQTVTVKNQTDEDAVLRFSNRKFSTTTTSIPAGEQVEVPVTFAPGNTAGEQTGTLTITAGDKSVKVDLRGFGLAPYAATIDPQTVDFGDCSINKEYTATVTLTNIGSNAITPTFTQPDEPFSVTGDTGELLKGETRTYTVTFAPTVKDTFSSEFTIADASHGISYRVTLSGKGADMVLDTNSPLNFGLVDLGDSKTLEAEFTNPYSDEITVSLSLSANAPFSLTNGETTLTIPAGQSKSVSVTFAPTEAGGAVSYSVLLTASGENIKTDVVLRGAGRVDGPEAIRDKAFFEGIEYTWKEWQADGQGKEHTNNLSEIATDPDQIIAMLREVYINKEIPGNWKRGFDANGGNETGNDVSYAGVGTIISSGGNYSYADTYGWNIPAYADNIKQYNTSGRYYMDPEQYKPEQNGVTLLLVETKDALIGYEENPTEDWMYTWRAVQTEANGLENNYAKLRTYISKSIKSVRVITDAKRTGEDLGTGTLFKIDCDKMNKFYLMAKGQLLYHRDNNCPYPYYYNGSWTDDASYTDYPFYHMFEQFSPTMSGASSAKDDIYQELVNMESFGVKHDCTKMLYRAHQFLMYGMDSKSEDCQDVRDMMFFVPDYRMITWSDASVSSNSYENRRDPNSTTWKYFNYNIAHQPQMGLFVIHQDEITDAAQVSGKNLYKHSLKWKSNLDDFLPGKEQEYELWEIVVDDFGMESYQQVYYRNANGEYLSGPEGAEGTTVVNEENKVGIVLDREMFGSTFTFPNVYVDMKEGSQTKTYVIRGRDKEHFLSLQMSNFQEVFIPGTDPKEKARMIAATYYSRYNPKNEKNCYSNRLELSNNGMTLTADDLSNKLYFYRSSRAVKMENGEIVLDNGNIVYEEVKKELVATATANGNRLTVVLANQGDINDYPDGVTSGNAAGYHANPSTLSFPYTIRNEVVNFTNNFKFWDNFTVDVSKNAHPLQYLYKMEVGTQNPPIAYSNEVRVPVYKTDSKINCIVSLDHLIEDNEMNEAYSPGDVEFEAKVQMSSKTEILRYDAYRWSDTERKSLATAHSQGISIVDEVNGDDEGDIAPTGIAGNQGDWYTVSMNEVGGDYYYVAPAAAQPTVSTSSPTNWANFIDYYPNDETTETANEYLYAPVVELFTKGYMENGTTARKDYNSYGGPQKYVATGRMELNPYQPDEGDNNTDMALMSDYKWYMNGKWYSYYNVYLNFSNLAVPTTLEPGYELYKVRAWRKVTGKIKNENNEYEELTGSGVLGEEISTRQVRVVDGWYMYEDINFGDDLGLTNAAGEHIEGYMSKDELKGSYYLGHRSTKIEKPKYPESYSGYSEENQGGGPVFEPDNTTNPNAGQTVESLVDNEMRATFGALRLKTSDDDPHGTLEELKVEFKVRAYFTKTNNPLITPPSKAGGEKSAADFDYYVTEATTTFIQEAGSGVITGISAVIQDVNREVVGVTYVNPIGQMSSTPWRGINIIVTRYSDGSTTTKKVIR